MDCVSCHRSFIGSTKLCVDCQLMEDEANEGEQ